MGSLSGRGRKNFCEKAFLPPPPLSHFSKILKKGFCNNKLEEKTSYGLFSAVLNGENAATKNSHRPKLTVCGNFIYIGRRRSEDRLPPGGSWRRRRLGESA